MDEQFGNGLKEVVDRLEKSHGNAEGNHYSNG